MPSSSYHTTQAPVPSEPEHARNLWREEVGPRLPTDLAAKARELKAFERVRGLADPLDLLRGVLAYVLCAQASSFRRLGVWAVLMDVASISEAAWRKHLLKASAWLLWLLGALLEFRQRQASIRQQRVPDGCCSLTRRAYESQEDVGMTGGCIRPMICKREDWCR